MDELIEEGSINHQVKLAIQSGLDPFLAYQLGSLNAAECYGLHTKGAIAPGYDADLLFISDLTNVQITQTMINGTIYRAANDAGAALCKPEQDMLQTVHLPDLETKDLQVPIVSDKDIRIIEIIPNQLETKLVVAKPKERGFSKLIQNPTC